MARNDFQNRTIYTDSDYVTNCGPTVGVPTGKTEPLDDIPPKPIHPVATEPLSSVPGETQIDDLLDGQQTPQTVGWLICVKGKCKGKDFHLHNGWNYIGRSPKSDVCIDDPKVSSTMARVSYDARNRSFAISTSEGAKNLTYCNNKAVYNTVEIEAYDTISMGDSDFVFVPLCGPHFTWEE